MNNVYITSNRSKSRYFIEILINGTIKLETRYFTLGNSSKSFFPKITSNLNDEFILKVIKIKKLNYHDE
jgi:hypothetical protein